MNHEPPVVQLIIPVHNEQECIASHLGQILAKASCPNGSYQLLALVIDDGSRDGTQDCIRRIIPDYPNVSLLELTRNFGKEAAILAGLEHSEPSADALVILDSDLQHPPEIIPTMVGLWLGGALVVEAIKTSRGKENLLSRISAFIFYGLFHFFAGLDLKGQSDFKLLDKRVVAQYISLPERQRFFRGLLQWMAFPTARVPFEVPERKHGKSKWGIFKLMSYALNNITSFSAWPLAMIFWLGMISLLLGGSFGAIAIYQKIQGQALNGFTTVISLLTFFGGLIMLSLGVIGHYLARIYDESKRRPVYMLRNLEERDNKIS